MSIAFTAQWKTGDGPQFGEDISIRDSSAAVVLSLLGYPEQAEMNGVGFAGPVLTAAFGDASGPDFLGRVLVARALLDTATDDEHGMPGYTEGGPGTGTAQFTDVGRSPGRLAEILDELEVIARDAAAHGGVVAWG